MENLKLFLWELKQKKVEFSVWLQESLAFYKEVCFLPCDDFAHKVVQYLKQYSDLEQATKAYFLFRLSQGETERELDKEINIFITQKYEGRIFSRAISYQNARMQ
jgi:hypothetical protein